MNADRLLPTDGFLATIRREADALAQAAGKDLRPCGRAPSGTSRRDVRHVGGVHGAWAQVVERQLRSPEVIEEPSASMLWRRRSVDDVRLDGDADLVRSFLARTELA